MSSDRNFLVNYGWNGFFESHLAEINSDGLKIGRVICEERNLYRIQFSQDYKVWGQVTGKKQFEAQSREDFPAVGDWILAKASGSDDRVIIQEILPRKSMLKRKQAGGSDSQILSTNVDYGFVTSSLNDDLNIRRIERYVTLIQDAGVEPVLLLTKADLSAEADELTQKVQKSFPTLQVYAISQENFENAHFFKELLKPGTTSVFLGSSGVGKSTLVNYLIGEQRLKTQSIREDDDKGRHTTTSRQLFVSRFGGLVIDTPGMRELQLLDHEEGLSSQFEEVEALLSQCRFSDCQHETEPGCAIIQALEDGSLEDERWQSYQKLLREVRHAQRKQDKALASEEKKKWKKISQALRDKYKLRE